MSKATKILNKVNKGLGKIGIAPPYYNWSKSEAVDAEVVQAIKKIEEFEPIEDEIFLFTSPSVRYYSVICSTIGHVVVTNKRIIMWNSYWQSKYRNSLLPIISLLDVTSLQRIRKARYWATAYTKSLSLKGNFITGNDPNYYFSSQIRSENILLHKNQDDFKFFREALAHHNLEIEELEKD